MTTIQVQVTGSTSKLEDVKVCDSKFWSSAHIQSNVLTLTYICEESDYDMALVSVMDSINVSAIESRGCDLVGIA